jgi:hypothetical protein
LFGRGRVLRFVADALDRSRNRETPPVVLLIGPRGSGKTVVIDRLEADNRSSAPTARLDFELTRDASPAQVMLDIGTLLSPGVARVGRVRFPLLGIGLIAVTLDPDSPVSAAEQLATRLRARGGLSGKALADLAAQAGRLLPSPEQQAMVSEAGAVLGWILDGISRRRLDGYLDWYARVAGRGNGTSTGPLLALHQQWRTAVSADDTEARRDARRDVWRALCAALLADLRAEFNSAGLWHGLRTTNCLLLLDNAGSPAGAELLETLAECRRKAAGQTDPLLVVAALGTRPGIQPPVGPPVSAADERLSHAGWLSAARDPEAPRSPWYPVQLTELSIGNVGSIVGSHVLGKVWRDVDFVHAVTGGHSAAAWEIARLLGRAGPGFDPRDLLTREVEDTLLGMLRPARLTDEQLAAMAVFGVTLHPQLKAGAGVFRSLGWRHVNELDIWDHFLDLMWAHGEDGFTIRPLPRLLLSRWLARDADLWERAHEGFLAHYRTREARDPVAEQYHLLALTTSAPDGNLGKVAAYLNGLLDRADRSVAQWNDYLVAITAAPNRLRHAAAERAASGAARDLRGDAEDVVKRMAGVSAPGDRLRTVTRLVAARWLSSDRLFDPERRLARLLDREYYELTQLTVGESDVFYAEASNFRRVAREWEDRL